MNLPTNDKEIRAWVLISLITDLEKNIKKHGGIDAAYVYGPERDLVRRKLEDYKTEYHAILAELGRTVHS